MKNWVIVRDKQNQIFLINKENFEVDKKVYEAIDDTDSEYKARIKMKEIKSMGLERYLQTTVRKRVKT